ncbi:MAG: hypothetical protein ABI091_10340, partial [Ferruginibacter sp.]
MKTEEDIRIKTLHTKAKQLLKTDMDDDEIINELKKEGIDSNYANLIIDNVRSDSRDRTDALKLVFMGTSFIVGGFYINYFSYRIAVNSNSTFFYLFWGVIVAGILMLIKAFS